MLCTRVYDSDMDRVLNVIVNNVWHCVTTCLGYRFGNGVNRHLNYSSNNLQDTGDHFTNDINALKPDFAL